MKKKNRKIKDSVFCDLFGADRDAKKNFLSLYNAIHGTNLKIENTKVERKEIPQSIYKTFNNDVSMLINNQLVIMVEHQSTINENMPLRMLEYLTRIYETMIPDKERYKEKSVRIPKPEFYVFYNGLKEYPDEKLLKLSDSFFNLCENDEIQLELTVKVYNIGPGKKLPIVNTCDILKQYCQFVRLIRTKVRAGDEESYRDVINQAIKDGILSDYLRRHATEIINMCFAEYDYDLDMQVKYEEAYEEACKEISEKLTKEVSEKTKIETAKAFFKEGISAEIIARCVGLPMEKVKELGESLNA